jgi:threonine aldolase
MAKRANALATGSRLGLRGLPGVTLRAPVEINEVFIDAAPAILDGLERDGVRFSRRAKDYRAVVTRHDGTEAEITRCSRR